MTDLRQIHISDHRKAEILFQLKVLNEYMGKAETLTLGEITYLKQTLPQLIGLIPLKVDSVSSFKIPFKRIVINNTVCPSNKRLHSLADLRYPPRDIIKKIDYNRASLKEQTIFYAGNAELHITIETKPTQGQLITTSTWVLNKGSVINLLVICQDEELALANPNELLNDYNEYVHSMQQLTPNTKDVVVAVYAFIIKAFTRKVNPSNRQGYLFSALLADLFFNLPNNPVDAIYYPSVPNKGSAMNIAIKPDIVDKALTMIEAKEGVVQIDPSKGADIWFSFITGISTSYNKDTLKLDWVNQYIPSDDPINKVIRDHKVDIS